MNRLIAQHRDVLVQGLDDAVGHDLSLFRIGLRKQHRELISADPRQDVRLAHAMSQRSGDALEQIVARLVAERVVDVLEVVEIDQKHCARRAVARTPLHLLGQFLLEAAPVEQTGQEIVIDHVFEASRQLLALRDVLDLRDHVERLNPIIADQRDGHEHPELMAPGVAVALLDLVALDLAVQQLSQLLGVEIDVVRIRDGLERRCPQLVPGITGDPAERVVDLQPATFHVNERHADRRAVERGLEPCMDLAQGTLRLSAVSSSERSCSAISRESSALATWSFLSAFSCSLSLCSSAVWAEVRWAVRSTRCFSI